jgi:hypothetical protein
MRNSLASAIVTGGLITGAAIALFCGDPGTAGTAVRSVCQITAEQVYLAQDYTGDTLQYACLGEEDDARVGLALDYGMTQDVYAANERWGR